MPKKKSTENKVLKDLEERGIPFLSWLEGQKNKSAAIRALGVWEDVLRDPSDPSKGTRRQRKYPIQDIADALNIRYQHAYNVLKKKEKGE